MSLVFDLLSAINNPNQEASVDQLSQITGSLNEIATSNGLNPSNMQNILGSLGSILRPALKEQAGGGNMLEGMLGQLAGGGGLGALSSFLTPELQNQIVQGVATRTGLSADQLQGLIPQLLPIVMGLLSMGKTTSGIPGNNPVLRSFLDSDRDGDVDLGDVFKIANRFLNPPQ